MSARHPIVAVTGSSGAGTSSTRALFQRMFAQLGLDAASVDGDSFHAYDREQMRAVEITLGKKLDGKWTLRRVKEPSDAQKAAYAQWLGQKWPE